MNGSGKQERERKNEKKQGLNFSAAKHAKFLYKEEKNRDLKKDLNVVICK